MTAFPEPSDPLPEQSRDRCSCLTHVIEQFRNSVSLRKHRDEIHRRQVSQSYAKNLKRLIRQHRVEYRHLRTKHAEEGGFYTRSTVPERELLERQGQALSQLEERQESALDELDEVNFHKDVQDGIHLSWLKGIHCSHVHHSA